MPSRIRIFALRCAVACAVAAAPCARAWGPAGHQIVALIAQSRLSPAVQARIATLLLDGQFSLAQVSSCPDALRSAERVPLKPEDAFCLQLAPVPSGSAPWHYIDIPIPKAPQPIAAYCPGGNCITAKIKAFRDQLEHDGDIARRREALVYLVHFLGDIHQPLHCAERECDQGGNLEHVNLYRDAGPPSNLRLHGVWDFDLLNHLLQNGGSRDPAVFANLLARSIPPDAAAWQNVSIDTMAWESWALARTHAYRGLPGLDYCDPEVKAAAPIPARLGTAYQKDAGKVIRLQLMKAGVRLAYLLEQALQQ